MNARTLHWLLPLAGAAGLHAAVALVWLVARPPAPGLGGAAAEGIDVSLALAGAEPQASPAAAAPEPAPQPPAPQPEPAPKPAATPVPAPAPVEPGATATNEPAAATASADTTETSMPAQATSATPTPGGQAGGDTGAKSRFSGKPARNVRGYFGQIASWIDANKDYPVECKKAKEQGAVVVRFTIDRNGRLLASSIKQSSGHPRLDKAALATLARAAPFPPIPDFVGRDTLSIAVPIDYALITD